MAKIKNFFKKIWQWLKDHRPTRRRIVQVYSALLFNSNLKGFKTGRIYTGNTKGLCVPGLNCYSCPGAVGACPLGSLQNALLLSSRPTIMYMLGILMLFGLILGRTICGWLCPMGLFQELLHKIRSPKLKKSRVTRVLSYFKYVLLVLLIAIPLIYGGIPFFCKYICPAGTFEGAVGLLSNPANADFFAMLDYLFSWKFLLLIVFVVACIFIFRFFCRFFCPLGAIYGFFNKIALLGIKLDKDKCIECGKCIEECPMDIKKVGDHECINCGKCIGVCPTKAISWKGSKFVFKNTEPAPLAVAAPSVNPIKLSDNGVAVAVEQNTVNEAENPLAKPNNSTSCRMEEAERKTSVEPSKKSNGKELKPWAKVCKIVVYVLAVVLLVTAIVYYNFIDKDDQAPTSLVGTTVPEFTLELYDTNSNETEFSTVACRGKVTVINFWQVTCDPCIAELPHFEELFDYYNGAINMVAINDDVGYSKNYIQKFISGQIREDVVWNNYDMMIARRSETFDAFKELGGKNAYPITVIVNAEGVITNVNQGALSYDELKAQVESAMVTE